MKQYVLDSSAVLAYLRDVPDAAKVERLLDEAEDRKSHLAISAVNWAECRYVLTRQTNSSEASRLLGQVANAVELVVVDRSLAESAGDLRCRFNGSLADCFAASLALKRNAMLVTTDPEFEALRREVKIMRLSAR